MSEQITFKKKIRTPLLPLGILNFTWHTFHELLDKQSLKINVPETFYFIDGESYLMLTNEKGMLEKRRVNP